jgi:hypothetical protein
MSNRARSAPCSAATAVALGFVLLCLCASLCASAQESTKGLDGPTRDGKGIRTFRNGIGMTEFERMVALTAQGCASQIIVGGRKIPSKPCPIGEDLQAAFAKSAEGASLSEFLQRNNFNCTKMINKTRCHNTFKVIHSPRDPYTGVRTNPDIEETYTTDVGFRQTKLGPFPAQNIRVTFTRVSRQLRN